MLRFSGEFVYKGVSNCETTENTEKEEKETDTSVDESEAPRHRPSLRLLSNATFCSVEILWYGIIMCDVLLIFSVYSEGKARLQELICDESLNEIESELRLGFCVNLDCTTMVSVGCPKRNTHTSSSSRGFPD